MAELQTNDEEKRRQAAELFATAQQWEAQGNYTEALKNYEQSLSLCEDELVLAAYLRALAAVGPM
jgi:tetratricopeptide (TPR) repeat protein